MLIGPAISVRRLSKAFSIYNRPHDRLKEIFSLSRKVYHNTFWALKDISFDVPRGKIVGIIGRNGAGKSTLLKIITGTLQPTRGQVTADGKISAILELGTGFYPEFTGIKNIYLNGRMLGLTKKDVDAKINKIIEFSELGEFINQPVKTYSSGMYARLAFSVAAFLDSEIMIIDEALSVGDMYFVHKCFNRMKEICSSGRTVLFVSHDLSYVQRLCDRVIWIEKGKIEKDGPALEVSKAYSSFIMRQEEFKLRKKNESPRVGQAIEIPTKNILFHLVTDKPHPVYDHPISKISLQGNGTEYVIDVGGDGDSEPPLAGPGGFIVLDGSNRALMDWGPSYLVDGRAARNYSDEKGEMAHAPFQFMVPAHEPLEDFVLEIDYKRGSAEQVYCEVYVDGQYVRLGVLPIANQDNSWDKAIFCLKDIGIDNDGKMREQTSGETEDVLPEDVLPVEDEWGIGKVNIIKVRFTNADEKENVLFRVGEPINIQIRYVAHEDILEPVAVVAVYRLDGVVAFQYISSVDGYSFGILKKGEGVISLSIKDNHLGVGHYVVSAALFPSLDVLDKRMQEAYALHDRKYEFKVIEDNFCAFDLGIVRQQAKWSHSLQEAK